MIIEPEVRYRPGKRTFIYLLFRLCWWLLAIAAGFGYLSYALYVGGLHAVMSQFLAAHPQWYIDTSMLGEWSLLISVSFLLITFLRISVGYRQYSFYVDDHAFHLRRGQLRVQEITIPYRQISNVHIEQPYHWRLVGLAQLDITISSSREALRPRKRRDFLIPCIDKSLAKALSRFLIREASDGDEEENYDDDDEYDDEEDAEDVSIPAHE